MPDAAKMPCRICRRWFRPHVRVGSRQRTCGRLECQQAQRKQTLAAWRARNPEYFVAWRIQVRSAPERRPEPVRLPDPLSCLPWDIAQEEFGRRGTAFIESLGSVLVRIAKNQLQGQVIDNRNVPATLAQVAAKNQFPAQVVDSS
jgi:hypothetical protein